MWIRVVLSLVMAAEESMRAWVKGGGGTATNARGEFAIICRNITNFSSSRETRLELDSGGYRRARWTLQLIPEIRPDRVPISMTCSAANRDPTVTNVS